ncbi:MAG: ATP-binding cassette domain-containing protein [Synergistaceae bacterium]
MNTEQILSLEGVEFQYSNASKLALDSLDLEINPNEWVAILGPNGSGKSTLMKILGALLIPTQGLCFVGGEKTTDKMRLDGIREQIGYIFQNPDDQIVASTVEEDIAFAPENLGFSSEEIQIKVNEVLQKTGIYLKKKNLVSSLSGGEKQRLALAGVLVIKPKILLLDEPTSMLDSNARNEFINIINEEYKNGATIIQITHKLEEIINADKVIVMKDSKIAWHGKTETFLTNESKITNEIKFRKPSIILLRDELEKEGILQENTSLNIDEIEEQICRYI